MPKSKKCWFIDTMVISNFALAEKSSILSLRYGRNLKIPQEVYQEILNGIDRGHSKLSVIVQSVNKKQHEKIDLSNEEKKEYLLLLRTLGPGESACIAAALFRKGIVISDDRLARNICREKNIPCSGSIGILKASYLDKTLELSEADMILNRMIDNGFYSPVRSISDIL